MDSLVLNGLQTPINNINTPINLGNTPQPNSAPILDEQSRGLLLSLFNGANNPNQPQNGNQPPNPPPQGGVNDDSAYNKGVKKALSEAGYGHAQEAIQQGVPPEHIENQISTAQTSPQSINKISEPLSGMDILRGILPMLAMPNMVKNALQTQYGETPQGKLGFGVEQAKQTPPTQFEQAQVQAGVNTATIQAMNDANTRLQGHRDQLTKEFTAEGQTIPGWEKGIGIVQLTPRMKQIQRQLRNVNQTQSDLLESFMSYKPTNILNKVNQINKTIPKYSVGSTIQVKGKSYKITGFENGKHTIQEVK